MASAADLLVNLSSTDRALFWKYGTGAKMTSPFSCVHHAFEFHASSNPDFVAVEDFEKKITYAELERQANCLAVRLRESGVKPDSRVVLLVERSIPMVLGILGILKAGAAYVPLDGNIVSDSTLKQALRDSESTVALTLSKFKDRLVGAPLQALCLEDVVCSSPDPGHCVKPHDVSNSKHGVYVIYTSGTTGAPKGVNVTHGNVTNLVCLEPGNLGMRPGLRVSQLMNISFDMAAWEILGSLCNGSTLCLRGKTSKEWRAVMKSVDIIIATPSMLVPHNPVDYPAIKTVAVAGEPCPKALADSWGSRGRFYNSCGPTEITIVNTMQSHTPGEFLTIGGPTPNNSVYVLDEDMRPVPIGESGVMWAGGAGITRGYVNLPQLTKERYLRDPFANDGQQEIRSKMFNTGDLGRWHPNGTLEPLGRIDNQVKIKGFRVELDGVATAMETCTGVKAGAALLIDGILWGFVMPAIVTAEQVKAAASKIQPYYAVPTKVIVLEDFPKTANGKTDKRALKQLALDSEKPAEVATEVKTAADIRNTTKSVISLPEGVTWINLSPTIISIPQAAHHVNTPPTLQEELSTALALPSQTPAQPLPHRASDHSLGSSNGSTIVGAKVTKVDSEASSAIEKENYYWTGYEDDELPEKTQGHIVRNLRHQIFSLYRRLFGIVFLTNMAVFISVCVKGKTNAQQLGGIVIANLFAGILMRQEYVINTFFAICCNVPRSWPLAIRRVCARVYHIGGLHSGFGVSGTVWLILFTAQATKELVQHGKTSVRTVAITYCILALLLGIIVFAHPTVRMRVHDRFERTHRFLGWTATALVWVQFMFLTIDYKPLDQPLGKVLIHSAYFWLLIILTCSIILPWVRLRKVNVKSERLSDHAVRIYLDHVTPGAGSFMRISTNPLIEWHSFATLPVPGVEGYSVVVSKVGDWTTEQINNPPTKIWIRGIPTYGVMRIAPLFRRLVVVATGSGMGPCAPAIFEARVPIKLLWTAPNVRQTFGDKLVDSILAASPDAVIYDTRKHGKPDMVKLTYRLVKEFNAEAVAIISNQKLTQKVVYGMMSRGIPAFGAIWDS